MILESLVKYQLKVIVMNEKEIIKNKKKAQDAYQNEMLIACKNGKSCSYGICDECPNTLGSNKDDNEE